MIPSIGIVRIETPRWRIPGVWLPLILLWIPVVLLSPLILLAVFCIRMAGVVSVWRAIAVFWGIFCSLPGTTVRVCAEGNRVQVRIL